MLRQRCRSKTPYSHENILGELLMKTVDVSKLGNTGLIFVDPGVHVDEAYYLLFCHNSCCLQYVKYTANLSPRRRVPQHTGNASFQILIFYKVE